MASSYSRGWSIRAKWRGTAQPRWPVRTCRIQLGPRRRACKCCPQRSYFSRRRLGPNPSHQLREGGPSVYGGDRVLLAAKPPSCILAASLRQKGRLHQKPYSYFALVAGRSRLNSCPCPKNTRLFVHSVAVPLPGATVGGGGFTGEASSGTR